MCISGETSEETYVTSQLVTYIGNKRQLLDFIGKGVDMVKASLGREKLVTFDVFSGSGVVSRYLKRTSSCLYANDLEPYCQTLNECYLANVSEIDMLELRALHHEYQERVFGNLRDGLIRELYSPKDEHNIKPGERVFYTVRNARIIDTARQEIDLLPPEMRRFFLGPLLHGASVHVNTGGVFKGFYKNYDGIGQFGGHGRNAMGRICADIKLPMPVFSQFECDCHALRMDAIEAAQQVGEVDLAYLDPPYNQHPYGSNYFMLNLILEYKRPEKISKVAGIPPNWNHSDCNVKQKARDYLERLIDVLAAKFILISYNSEGFVKYDEFLDLLEKFGDVTSLETRYNTYRASRNLNARNKHVKEFLFLLKKHSRT